MTPSESDLCGFHAPLCAVCWAHLLPGLPCPLPSGPRLCPLPAPLGGALAQTLPTFLGLGSPACAPAPLTVHSLSLCQAPLGVPWVASP